MCFSLQRSPESADQDHWHHCKILAEPSMGKPSGTHISTLSVNLETARVNLATPFVPPDVSPTRRQGCQDFVRLWTPPFCTTCVHSLLGSLFYPISIMGALLCAHWNLGSVINKIPPVKKVQVG